MAGDPRGGQPSPRQRAAAAAKKGGGKVLRNVVVTTTAGPNAPKGTFKMIAMILRGYARGFTPSEDQRTITANIEREKAGKMLYSVRKMLPDPTMVDLRFVQNGTDITDNVIRDAKAAAKEQQEVRLSPELAERAAAARAAAAAAGDPSALAPANPFETEADGEDDSEQPWAPPPSNRTREPSRPPAQVEGQTWGWPDESKGPPKLKPGVTYQGPRFAGLDPERTDAPEAWAYGDQYRPQDEEKLEVLSRRNLGPKDHKNKVKVTLGPNSDRRYVLEFGRGEQAGVWIAYRMGSDYADRREVGRSPRFGVAVRGIIDYERVLWTKKVKGKASPASAPAQAAPAQTQASVKASAPMQAQASAPQAAQAQASAQAGASFTMCMLVPGPASPGAPRWGVRLRDQIVAFGDDLEVVMATAKAAIPGAILILSWDGKPPARPAALLEPLRINEADQQRLRAAMNVVKVKAAGEPVPIATVKVERPAARPEPEDESEDESEDEILGAEDVLVEDLEAVPWEDGFPVALGRLRDVLRLDPSDLEPILVKLNIPASEGVTMDEATAQVLARQFGLRLVQPEPPAAVGI